MTPSGRIPTNDRRPWPQLAAAVLLATSIGPLAVVQAADKARQTGNGAAARSAERVVEGWPKASKEAAMQMIAQYGPPSAADAKHLQWNNNGPWKYTIVHRDPSPHNFPMKHEDVLEQGIDYRVPPGKFSDLAFYDGSVHARRTKGEVSAMCDKEPMNFLAINLANDIVSGKASVDEARQTYGKIAMAFMKGEKHAYTQGLAFERQKVAAGDPDQPLKESVAAR